MKQYAQANRNVMRGTRRVVLLACMLFPAYAYPQIRLEPDGKGNTYELIEQQFGKSTYEVPDCGHTSFGHHITEVFDDDLGKHVFVFHIHATLDDDRCRTFDRQRNEIKGANQSPDELKHTLGETVYARWKFKLDAGFKPSSRFTHLMQIKPFDGDASLPVITLTARAGNPDKMEVNHSSGEGTGSLGKIANVDLAPFKGTWVEVLMQFKNGEGADGSLTIVIKRVSDGVTLLSVEKTAIDLWRTGTTYNRLKWGIYRGLSEVLRDEQVRFADFCISETSASQCVDDIVLTTEKEQPEVSTAIRSYPNPTSKTLTVEYEVKEAGLVRLSLLTVNANQDTVLLDDFRPAGVYQYTLDTHQLSSGVHLLKLYSSGKRYVHKFIRQ